MRILIKYEIIIINIFSAPAVRMAELFSALYISVLKLYTHSGGRVGGRSLYNGDNVVYVLRMCQYLMFTFYSIDLHKISVHEIAALKIVLLRASRESCEKLRRSCICIFTKNISQFFAFKTIDCVRSKCLPMKIACISFRVRSPHSNFFMFYVSDALRWERVIFLCVFDC